MKAAVVPVSRLPLASWSLLAARLADFVTLMKPRVMLLAVFTALVGLMIAPSHALDADGPHIGRDVPKMVASSHRPGKIVLQVAA